MPKRDDVLQSNRNLGLRLAWVGFLCVLAYSAVVDDMAQAHLQADLTRMQAVHASARAIDATLAVAQSVYWDERLSVGVGQLLAPAKNTLARFVALVENAITNLWLHGQLLQACARIEFDLAVIFSASMWLWAVWRKVDTRATWRLFLGLWSMRMAVPLLIVLHAMLGSLFGKTELRAGQQSLMGWQEHLSELAGYMGEVGLQRLPNMLESLAKLDAQERSIHEATQRLHAELADLQQQLEQRRQERPWWDWELWTRDPQTLRIKQAITERERELEGKRQYLEQIGQRKESVQTRLDCLEQRSQGQTCQWLENWQVPSQFDLALLRSAYAMDEPIRDVLRLKAIVLLYGLLSWLGLWVLFVFAVYRGFGRG